MKKAALYVKTRLGAALLSKVLQEITEVTIVQRSKFDIDSANFRKPVY